MTRKLQRIDHTGARSMNKGQRGNKEAKKPKKPHPPNPAGVPEGVAPTVGGLPRPKKR